MFFFTYGICQSWLYAVNDIWGGVQYPHHSFLPYRSLFNPRFDRVIHVVRSPLAHIASFTAHTHLSYEFVRNFMPLESQQYSDRTALTVTSPFQVISGLCYELIQFDSSVIIVGF
jgi:hypothetical protein